MTEETKNKIGCQGCGPFIPAKYHLCDACYKETLKLSAWHLAYHLVKWTDKYRDEGHDKIPVADLIHEIDNQIKTIQSNV